jgi:hypothetical protein
MREGSTPPLARLYAVRGDNLLPSPHATVRILVPWIDGHSEGALSPAALAADSADALAHCELRDLLECDYLSIHLVCSLLVGVASTTHGVPLHEYICIGYHMS